MTFSNRFLRVFCALPSVTSVNARAAHGYFFASAFSSKNHVFRSFSRFPVFTVQLSIGVLFVFFLRFSLNFVHFHDFARNACFHCFGVFRVFLHCFSLQNVHFFGAIRTQ